MVQMQLGKAGLSENFIETLRKSFKRHENIKIALLKTCSRDREEIEEIAKEICSKLGNEKQVFKYKILGFTIFLKRCKRK